MAIPFENGGALRLALPVAEINQQVNGLRTKILGGTALAFLPAIALAALLARYVSRRFAGIMNYAGQLASGNFHARLPADTSEFGQFAAKLNETAAYLQNTVAQLEHEHTELEKLDRIRKDFVINVSHELRTPLASIQGYTETLMDGALGDPQHNMRFLTIIRHNAERLARITSDLLTLSRLEMKRLDFQFEIENVEELLGSAAEIVWPIAARKNIELTVEPPLAGTTVYCDAEAVSQIFSNLLDNAIKYTPEGGRIAVGATPAGKFMELYVRDTGIGIPAEDLPRLFERFYRVDKARSRELGGTGLGLSIVKHLVYAQNGATRVESCVKEGSTFYFTLPATAEGLGRRGEVDTDFTVS